MKDLQFDLRQSKNYSDYLKTLGWESDHFENIFISIKKILFWKIIKIQRPKIINNVAELFEYLKKNYRFASVYIEPMNQKQYSDLKKEGWSNYNSPFLPSKTICLDLKKTEDGLLSEMHYKTRYNIIHNTKLNGQNSKIKIIKTKDIEKFAEFWQKCAKKRGMFLSQKKEIIALHESLGKNSVIHAALDHNSDWLAALMRVSSGITSYYMYAASSDEGKACYAPTLLAWDAMISAKREGRKLFDFEGIYDERFPLESWRGFSRFKIGFGGQEVEYPPALKRTIL